MRNTMIVLINYGMGNNGSILNMLKKIGIDAIISSHVDDIKKAHKLILPGVGAFDNGMKNLNNLDLTPILHEKVMRDKTPILGICLGMQLLTQKSEEGSLPGLGWIDAQTIKFNHSELKIPHMGWNTITVYKQSALFREIYQEPKFYFVHSYHVMCSNENDILTKTFYGYEFVSSIQQENIIGVQFHPEKSHKYGMKLLKNFVENF
ncbi:MAG: imidazole glycerol phosphate synthase subunit HisH [Candidatus Jettenia sp. CY-1]|nr:MAG: imidazole glycerol phosphate synthase subunit HisH [Candidatus Jettenia sp. CY-1]